MGWNGRFAYKLRLDSIKAALGMSLLLYSPVEQKCIKDMYMQKCHGIDCVGEGLDACYVKDKTSFQRKIKHLEFE